MLKSCRRDLRKGIMLHFFDLIAGGHCRYDWISDSFLIKLSLAMSYLLGRPTFTRFRVSVSSLMRDYGLSWKLVSICLDWKDAWRWLVGSFLFFFIIIIIVFWSLITPSSRRNHPWLSSMSSRRPIKVISSEILLLKLILNVIFHIWPTTCCHIVLFKLFKLRLFLSFLYMEWDSSSLHSLLNSLSLSLKVLDNLSLQVEMLVLKSLNYLLKSFLVSFQNF